MLSAFLTDCASWGGVRTMTVLDRRLAGQALPADDVIVVQPGRGETALAAALARCDAALVIAPEAGGTLARLSRQVLAAGAQLIGSGPAAIELAGDKWACYRQWQAAGVPTPLTRQVLAADAPSAALELGFPLVVKPVDGVGCVGVSLVRAPAELEPALQLAVQDAAQQRILLQRYVAGKDASVTLLVAEGRALPLSLNGQDVETGRPFTYHGGVVPLAHPLAQEALAAARAAAAALPGLRGYVGVDLVLDDAAAWAIEVNPRLTTAYIGLRQVADINLAEAIWQACLEGRLPDAIHLRGRAVFNKDGRVRLEEAA